MAKQLMISSFLKSTSENIDLSSPEASTSFNVINEEEEDEVEVSISASEPELIDSEVNEKSKKRIRRKKYVQKCCSSWTTRFDWLISKDERSYCKYCHIVVTGGISHMSRHESRRKHIRLVKSTKNTVDIKQYQLKNDEKKVLSRKIKECELKLCMLLIEHNLPMVLMDHLPKLLKSAVPDSDIIKGINCSRTKTTCLLKNFQEESERTLSEILQRRKFSLIVDETTDISIQKCLAVVTRYTDIPNESVRDRLLALVRVQDLSADGIVNKILEILEKMSIPIQNFIGFAADNAAVMMGKYNGVQARLKQLNENAFVIGCVCHSLHLCASAAAKKLPNEIEDFVRNIYNYLNCSSKRLQEYKEFQDFVRIKPHKLLKPSQTRWLSLEAVVRRTLEQWPALQLFFNAAVVEDDLATAGLIFNCLNDNTYKLYLSFLCYILPMINKLNLEFQAEKPQLCNVYIRIETICKTILKNFMNNKYVDSTTSFLQVNELNVREYKPLENLYMGTNVCIMVRDCVNLKLKDADVHTFKLNCLSYYIELFGQLKRRFHNIDSYKAFSHLSPNIVLSGDMTDITDLIQRFPNFAKNIEEINNEYRELSNLPNELKRKLTSLHFEEFWFSVFKYKNALQDNCFENICNFVFDIMALPHSSACAERIFSTLNNIKTKNRNKLLPATCNSLLLGKELCHTSCYDWSPSLNLINKKVSYD